MPGDLGSSSISSQENVFGGPDSPIPEMTGLLEDPEAPSALGVTRRFTSPTRAGHCSSAAPSGLDCPEQQFVI